MRQAVPNQRGSGPPGDREILRRGLAAFLERQAPDAVFAGVTADPPNDTASWNSLVRFFLAVEGEPRVRWQTAHGVMSRRLPDGGMVFLPERSWIQVDREQFCRTLGIVLFSNFVRFRMATGSGSATNPPPAAHWHHTVHPAPPLVHELLARAGVASSSAARSMCLATAVHLLAEHLDEDAATEMGLAESLFHSICHYLTEHVGERLDRSVAAAVFDRHPSHISEVFKTYGGCTFHQYLTRVRLDHARELLLHSKLPVKAIAAACGYETQSHFGTVFRRHCGLSPAAYRAGHKE